jgi:hypothetical protein
MVSCGEKAYMRSFCGCVYQNNEIFERSRNGWIVKGSRCPRGGGELGFSKN